MSYGTVCVQIHNIYLPKHCLQLFATLIFSIVHESALRYVSFMGCMISAASETGCLFVIDMSVPFDADIGRVSVWTET